MFSKFIIFVEFFLLVSGFPNAEPETSEDISPGSFYSVLVDGLTPEQKAKIEEIGNNAKATKNEIYEEMKQQFESWGISDKVTKVNF